MQSARSVEQPDISRAADALRQAGARDVFTFRWLSSTDAGVREEDWFAVRGLPPAVYFQTLARVSDVLDRDVDVVDLDQDTPLARYLLESGELAKTNER